MLRKNAAIVGSSLFLVIGLLTVLVAGSATAAVKDEIKARTLPVGELCVVGDACAAGLKLSGAGNGPKTPDVIYNTYCIACHGMGVNNAPVFGNAEAWAPHIAKGIDTLYQSALNGFNNGAMPPKGTCVSCSDDEIKATVDYIVAAAKP